VDTLRGHDLVIPAGVSLHGRTLVARYFGIDRVSQPVWITLSGYDSAMASESAASRYPVAAPRPRRPSHTDHDSGA
jgi:hypothetical protein